MKKTNIIIVLFAACLTAACVQTQNESEVSNSAQQPANAPIRMDDDPAVTCLTKEQRARVDSIMKLSYYQAYQKATWDLEEKMTPYVSSLSKEEQFDLFLNCTRSQRAAKLGLEKEFEALHTATAQFSEEVGKLGLSMAEETALGVMVWEGYTGPKLKTKFSYDEVEDKVGNPFIRLLELERQEGN